LACKVARRAMVDFIRPHAKYLNEKSIFNSEEDDLLYMDILSETDEAELARQRCENLNKFLNTKIEQLPERGKQIIEMYLNQCSYSDISKIVGSTKQNICKYVARFRKDIANKLHEIVDISLESA